MGAIIVPSYRFVVKIRHSNIHERLTMVPVIRQCSVMLGKRSKEQKPFRELTKFSIFSPLVCRVRSKTNGLLWIQNVKEEKTL